MSNQQPHRLVNNPNAVFPCSQCGEPSLALAAGHDLPPSLAKLGLKAAIFVKCPNCGVRLAEPESDPKKPSKLKRKSSSLEARACFEEDARRKVPRTGSSSSGRTRKPKPKPNFRPDQDPAAPWGDDTTTTTQNLEPKDHTMRIRIPIAQFRLLQALAQEQGKDVSKLVREACFELVADRLEEIL